MPDQVVTSRHPQAAPTRDPDAERGVGRAYRYEANMLPRVKSTMTVQKPGVPWLQGEAYTINKDLTGQPGALTVAVRSGNTDPTAIGLRANNWGIAGVGDDAPQAAPSTNTTPLILGGLALLGAFFLLRKG